MKAVAISFKLKNQSQEKIFAKLEEVKKEIPDSFLIHSFLPRKIVLEKKFPTEVVDKLEQLFPIQLNMYNDKPLRDEMAIVAKQLDAYIYVIGEVIEEVAEEVEIYQKYGNTRIYFKPLD